MGIFGNIFGRDDDADIFDKDGNIIDEGKFREKYTRDNIDDAAKKGHEHIRNQARGMEDNLISNGSYTEYLAGNCSYDNMSDSDKAYIDKLYYQED